MNADCVLHHLWARCVSRLLWLCMLFHATSVHVLTLGVQEGGECEGRAGRCALCADREVCNACARSLECVACVVCCCVRFSMCLHERCRQPWVRKRARRSHGNLSASAGMLCCTITPMLRDCAPPDDVLSSEHV